MHNQRKWSGWQLGTTALLPSGPVQDRALAATTVRNADYIFPLMQVSELLKSRDVKRPIFHGLGREGCGLGLRASGLGLDVSGVDLETSRFSRPIFDLGLEVSGLVDTLVP